MNFRNSPKLTNFHKNVFFLPFFMRNCTTFVHFGARQPQGQSAGDDFKCSRAYEVPTAGVKRGKKVTAPGLAIFDTLIASLLN